MTNKFPIGVVAVTDYLLVVARKISDATVEAERHSFGPAPSAVNLVFTTLEPTNYYVDFRESSDGTALGTLIATFTFDAQSNQIIFEQRFYTCDGPDVGDPVAGANTIVDPYFVNKTISSIFKEGFRPLKPVAEFTISGDTITVINGTTFSHDEKIVVDITYKDALPGNDGATGFAFTGTVLLTANTTLNSSHYNKRLNNKASTSSLVHTFPALSTIPDGTGFYFKSFGGSQIQTRIMLAGTDKIIWDGFDFSPYELSEIWIGKGQWIWLEKNTDVDPYLEVISIHADISKVGEQLDADTQLPNTRKQDGALADGDDYPAIWWWINNKLPAAQLVVDDNIINLSYAFVQARIGQFVKHSTLKKFRWPKTMGLTKKGTKDFTTFGTDILRTYDYPGGYQQDAVGPLSVHILRGDAYTGNAFEGDGRVGGGQGGHPQSDVIATVPGTENLVKNTGVIHLRRI